MSASEQIILNDIVNALENLAVTVDALEAVLIRKGLLMSGEIQSESHQHVSQVVANLAATRHAISRLGRR
jgi:hypothetical protein